MTHLRLPTWVTAARATIPPSSRAHYHATPARRLPYKDTQDRGTLKPRSSQNTGSARDDDVAAHPRAAFDPSVTRPEDELGAAGGHDSDPSPNPLEVSGANQPINNPRPDGDKGPGQEVSRGGTSRDVRSQKKGKWA